MPDKGGKCLFRIKNIAAVLAPAFLCLIQSSANQPVLTGQIVDFPIEKQPLIGDTPSLGPTASGRSFLLPGGQFQRAVGIINQPAEARQSLRFSNLAGEIDQLLQALLPGGVRSDDVGQVATFQLSSQILGRLLHRSVVAVKSGKQLRRLHGNPEKTVIACLLVQVKQHCLKIRRHFHTHPME